MVEFIYFEDSWNEEEVRTSNPNIPRVEGSVKDAYSGTQQEKVHKEK